MLDVCNGYLVLVGVQESVEQVAFSANWDCVFVVVYTEPIHDCCFLVQHYVELSLCCLRVFLRTHLSFWNL